MRVVHGWSFALLLGTATAQRFPSGFSYDLNIPTLTSGCKNTLNQTIQCSWLLGYYAAESVDLSTQNLTTICTPKCYESLTEIRADVKSACPVSQNQIAADDGTYPATYQIDNLLDAYNKTCLRDPKTNHFCYDVMRPWQNSNGSWTSAQNCSDCVLATLQLDQSSEFSYNGDFAKEFAALTSSCGKTGFEPMEPTPTGLNSSSPASVTPTPTPSSCASPYTIKPDDTCNGICKAQNVSTFALLWGNQLPQYCNQFPGAGTKLCLPPSCDIYTVQPDDTCQGITAKQPGYITVAQLQSWNPNLNHLCTNMPQQEGMQICVSPPGDDSLISTVTTPSATPAPTTPAPKPTNIANGTNTNCGQYYSVETGDDCVSILIHANPPITRDDFLFLNPGVNEKCTNLLAGFSYCIKPVGDITTYPAYGDDGIGYSGSCTGAGSPSTCYGDWNDLNPTPFNHSLDTPRPTAPSTPRPSYTSRPLAPGTNPPSNCSLYKEWSETGDDEVNAYANSCAYVAEFYGITVEALRTWNKQLAVADPCVLNKGYRYCVGVNNGTTSSSTPGSSTSSTPVSSPSDSATTTISTTTTSTTSSTTSTTTTSKTTSTTTSTTTTSSDGVSTPTPTQTEMVSYCDKFHKVEKGDGCYDIAKKYKLGLDMFYKWNPDVGDDCENLWSGYYVCVDA